MTNNLMKNKKRLVIFAFFVAVLLAPAFSFDLSEGNYSFSLVYRPQQAQGFGWDDTKIWFDFDGLDSFDSKLIGIFEVGGAGVYDHAFYIEFNGLGTNWPYEDAEDNFYTNEDMDQEHYEGCPTFFTGTSEGYILVVGSDTNGGGNWDDFYVRVRVYDGGTIDELPGDQENTIGDGSSNRLRFIVYRWEFSGNPTVDIAAKYQWNYEWKECYPNEAAWTDFEDYVDDFWMDNDGYNAVNTANGLDTWSWPNPY